jgi:hypothetical protein
LLQNTIDALLSDDTLRPSTSLFPVGFLLMTYGLADFVPMLPLPTLFLFPLSALQDPHHSLSGNHIPLVSILFFDYGPSSHRLESTRKYGTMVPALMELCTSIYVRHPIPWRSDYSKTWQRQRCCSARTPRRMSRGGLVSNLPQAVSYNLEQSSSVY